MIQDKNNPIHWIADEGKSFFRKADNFEMGEEMWLGIADSIDNYEERDVAQPINEEGQSDE